jgi:uncharacterized membrane protein YtjA (UPF0391 family)
VPAHPDPAASEGGTKSPPPGYGSGEGTMTILKWAVIMLLVSLVAALFGFTDLAAASAEVARVLFYIFAVIFLVLLVLGLTVYRKVSGP